LQTQRIGKILDARRNMKQVAAVLTVKGRIAAATYRITLSHARYSLWAGKCPLPKIVPSLGGSAPPPDTSVHRVHAMRPNNRDADRAVHRGCNAPSISC